MFDFEDIELEEEYDLSLEDTNIQNNNNNNQNAPEVDSSDIAISTRNDNKKPTNESLDIDSLEEVNFIQQYTENIFMESILAPAAKYINDKIVDLKNDKTCSIEDMVDVLESIKYSGLHRKSQDKLVSRLMEAYNASRENALLMESEDYLIEYSGNPEKNAEFIKYLNLMEKYAQDYIDLLNDAYKVGDDILDIMDKGINGKKKAPTPEDMRVITNSCMNRLDEFNKLYTTKYSSFMKEDGRNFSKYESLRKKFNNKYSTETLQAKKEIDKKLDALFTTIMEGDLKLWFQIDDVKENKNYDKLVSLWEAMKVIDRDYASKILNNVLNPYLRYLMNVVQYAAGFVRYIRYHLDIEIEYRTSFKLVQKILKDKKDGYSEDTKSHIIKLK